MCLILDAKWILRERSKMEPLGIVMNKKFEKSLQANAKFLIECQT